MANGHTMAEKRVLSRLQNQHAFWTQKNRLKEQVIKPEHSVDELAKQIRSIAEKLQIHTKIKNMVMEMQGNHSSDEVKVESLQHVLEASVSWQESILEELTIIKREKEKHLSQDDQDGVRFLYDSDDVLDTLINISSPNHMRTIDGLPCWGSIQIELYTPNLLELKSQFAELHPCFRQIGLNDLVAGDSITQHRTEMAQRILKEGYIPLAQQYARRGIPQSSRASIWQLILHAGVSDEERCRYEIAQKSNADPSIEDLFRLDVKALSDDIDFFPFEETLYEIMHVFCNDSQVRAELKWQLYEPSLALPPCCVAPFRGLVNYAAPLLYLFQDHVELYILFRKMFSKYFSALNAIRSNSSILYLCKMFESLAQEACPEVFYHCIALSVQPLTIVFKWIHFAFVAYLPVEQVLLLWDRIIGFDSLFIIPVMAAAIFCYREALILRASTSREIYDIFDDGSELKTIPILQWFLFHKFQS